MPPAAWHDPAMARLLLLSNSTNHGRGYLDHAMPEIRAHLGPLRRLLFVPFALHDRGGYAGKVRERFAREGIGVDALTADDDGRRAIEAAQALFVGGGNTFRLLRTLQDSGLLEPLRRRSEAGMPYLGASAGINVACPTIRTTNDMPIVQPRSFDALGLIPFQINPHYVDADPASRHMGETREDRIREFLEESDVPVVGLREGTWLHIEDGRGTLAGSAAARVFRRGRAPEERASGSAIDDLLAP
jgi:dipeptidase E